ncbi:MAG: putative lipid II flippase FtsW [Candidatus Paceibacteria bacterium]
MEKIRSDYVFLSIVLALLVFGLIMLTSASTPVGLREFNDKYFFVKSQLLLGVLPGILSLLVFVNLKYKYLKKLAWVIFAVTIISLVLVFIPGIGSSLNTGSQSWIVLGGYSLQPSEFAKLGLIIFMAYYLSELGEEIEEFSSGFLPALIVGILPVALVAVQPDLGTTSILFAVLFGMLFVAGAKWSHMGILLIAAISAFAVMIAISPYRSERLTTFLHPELDPKGSGYQINQSFLALGSGGIFGRGLGKSRQKFEYLPEVHSDSIFAIIGEETGFVITTLVVLAFLSLFIRGFKVAKKAPDKFARLTVTGIILWLAVQTFVNIGAMVGLMPLTGVPLPFISHGGTALLSALTGVGIILNISKYQKQA